MADDKLTPTMELFQQMARDALDDAHDDERQAVQLMLERLDELPDDERKERIKGAIYWLIRKQKAN